MEGGSVELTLLGIAQDGGFPQVGCLKDCCEYARQSPDLSKMPVSLGIRGLDGSSHLIEASRMMAGQFDLWNSVGTPEWPPSSVSLTHAHLGHTDGLGLFGREVMGSSGIILHCSSSMGILLDSTPSWSIMIEQGVIIPNYWTPLEPFEPTPGCGFTLTAIPVPHRSELSDNHALIIRGDKKSLLFMPDQDSWQETLGEDLEILDWLEGLEVDIALIDGTFWNYDEISSRDVSEIPHPTVTETLGLLGNRKQGDPEISFIHFNHTNPLLRKGSDESGYLLETGGGSSEQGAVYHL